MVIRALSRTQSLAALVALASVVSLTACGGGAGLSTNTGGNTGGGASPAMITVGDAPMSSVLSALVTISAVTFTSSSGSVQLLQQPRTIELTQLGGIRAPLELDSLPQGTYNSVSITASAAQITYIDPNTQQVTQATAVIPAGSATFNVPLTNPLVVNSTVATDVRFDFDLQKSLDLTGSVVTFTPQVSAIVASVDNENDDDRQLFVTGTVTATSTTNNTITVTSTDTGLSVTLNVDANTHFDDNLTLATLATGTAIHTIDRINSDGSITALVVDDTDGGESEGSGGRIDGGLVTATTVDSSNNLTSFTMVIRDSLHKDNLGKLVTVDVNASTLFKDTLNAQNAGLATFDQTQIFPGQGVWVAGSSNGSGTNSALATEIRPAAVNPFGLNNAAVQTATGGNGFILTLLLDANTYFAKFANLSSLTVDINSNTVFDGQGLTSANVANLGMGIPLVARGFLSLNASATTLYCQHLHELGSGQ
jgi:hypothetical protein